MQTNLKLASRQITILYIVITNFYFLSLVVLKEPLYRIARQNLILKIRQFKSAILAGYVKNRRKVKLMGLARIMRSFVILATRET